LFVFKRLAIFVVATCEKTSRRHTANGLHARAHWCAHGYMRACACGCTHARLWAWCCPSRGGHCRGGRRPDRCSTPAAEDHAPRTYARRRFAVFLPSDTTTTPRKAPRKNQNRQPEGSFLRVLFLSSIYLTSLVNAHTRGAPLNWEGATGSQQPRPQHPVIIVPGTPQQRPGKHPTTAPPEYNEHPRKAPTESTRKTLFCKVEITKQPKAEKQRKKIIP